MSRFVLSFFAVCLCTTNVIAQEAAVIQTEVWKRYLSPTEQTALAEIEKTAQTIKEAQSKVLPTNPAELLAVSRRGFEEYTAELAPPLSSVKRESFEENGIKGLWFKPENAVKDKVLLYFHGGGYVVGNPITGGAVASFLAQEAKILCFSLDYPLAPETPYPAAPNNALAAYQMLLGKGFKPEHIVLAGDSAGGGLTLVTLLNIRDKKLPMPAGAYLLSPWTNLSHDFASHKDKKTTDTTLTIEFLQMMVTLYVGKHDPKDPMISPAFADLKGLPPLLVHVGSFEILLDDSLTVVRNAALANVPVKLTVFTGYQHVFQMIHSKLEGSRKALIDGAEFFNEVM